MEQTEHHHKEEHLEEDHEGVVVRGGEQDNGQEGGETAIEHCRANLEQGVLDPDIGIFSYSHTLQNKKVIFFPEFRVHDLIWGSSSENVQLC